MLKNVLYCTYLQKSERGYATVRQAVYVFSKFADNASPNSGFNDGLCEPWYPVAERGTTEAVPVLRVTAERLALSNLASML